jgi:type II secretory pathway component PulM
MMDELRRLFKKYPNQSFLIGLGLSSVLFWYLILNILALPLKFQRSLIEQQVRHLSLLKKLPENWQKAAKASDITDLLSFLSSQWSNFFPDRKDVSFAQVGQNQLKMTIKNIDEQALMQWLWAMQSQYAFKIVGFKMIKYKHIGIVSAQIVLQII